MKRERGRRQPETVSDVARRKTLGTARVPLRIWSAACSTGQELYSTAIVLKELLGSFATFDIRLLGTDISDKAVAAASRGYFNKLELERGTPFRQAVIQSAVARAKPIALTGLAAGTYYWQVRAVSTVGSTDADGGTWWVFSVSPTPPLFGKVAPTALLARTTRRLLAPFQSIT